MSRRWLAPSVICHPAVSSPGIQGSRWASPVPRALESAAQAAWLSVPLSPRGLITLRGAWSISMPFHLLSLGVMHGLICHLPVADAAHQSCCYLFICLLFLFSASARVVIQHAFAPTLCRTQYLLHLFSLQVSRERLLIIYEAPRPLRGSAHLSAEPLHCGWL